MLETWDVEKDILSTSAIASVEGQTDKEDKDNNSQNWKPIRKKEVFGQNLELYVPSNMSSDEKFQLMGTFVENIQHSTGEKHRRESAEKIEKSKKNADTKLRVKRDREVLTEFPYIELNKIKCEKLGGSETRILLVES